MHIYNWDEWAQQTIPVPMTVGHEFVGEIVEMGANVPDDLLPGMLVSGEGHVVCGHCRNCLAGKRHMCRKTAGIGVNLPGAFAEYIAIPYTNVWVHRDGIDRDVASIFDPFGNATHTALQWPLLGEDVLITGGGPIGCMAAAICRHSGARHVVVSDLSDFRLNLARKMGATTTVNPLKESIADVQRNLGMKEGFDVALEMSGSPDAFKDLIANMNHGGKVSVLGIPPKGLQIDWNKIVFSMLTIKGIYGREMYDTWYKMAMMIESGLDLHPIITHRYPVQQFQKGFDAMLSGKAGKRILKW
eukprot:NODE_2592_length_1160_cov_8.131413_g2371_i0.p1 GENE.NODE_2592_length_1160_cov_8.131413_g2371_i0~~NODE_2592_length_1160_cov_8.131413_g2371_i0.p1  ORF type:complete len:353 (+),score=57.50 NODE_2592_length_1160_cov_8.131413_g2371_i0:157-1059(+)